MFSHLNIHSVYSSMRGLLSLTEIMNLSRSHGMKTLALTDVNGIWGFVRFIQHCKESGISPIAGTNLVNNSGEVILLAESQHGYENMCRAISAVHSNTNYCLSEILKEHCTGLFVLSYHEPTLKKLNDFIPDTHLFIELRPGVQESFVNNLAKKMKLEIVATGDVYFSRPSDHNAYVTLRAIENNTTLERLNISDCKTDQHWFRNEEEMIQLFPNSLDALNNSKYLSDRCKTNWPFVNTVFPGISLKETYYANKVLEKKVYTGAKARYGDIDKIIDKRIRYELSIIIQKGFAPYFLIVQDIIKQTQSTIGRGSAAASIISYCLFITQVDPIQHKLQFERFIHLERKDMPDIDIDFPWDERDNILAYVFKKYGEQRTAMVSNQILLKPRSAIREVGKVHGLSNKEIISITRKIGRYRPSQDVDHLVYTDSRFSDIDLDDTMIRVLRDSKKIVGVFRYPSVHPGGVVIVPDEIRKYVPVLMAPKGVQIVEWEKDQVEDSGLLKIDLLGNRSLSVVRDTISQVNLNHGECLSNNRYIDYHQIQAVGDQKTDKLMKAGKTIGVFYIESPATRQLMAKAGVVDFDHVVIYSSIIRPAANQFINIMLERIHGSKWKLVHSDLSFLSESYGIMVYQEQVSMAVTTMAGLSYAESEALRKSLSRNSLKHLIPLWEKKFLKGAIRRGYAQNTIEQVWNMIKSFSGYSFCKPHSASYAMLSFTCAYLKAHFPAEFMSSVISNKGGFYSTYAYMSEARRLGIKICPPDINMSYKKWRGQGNVIRMGFMSIKNLQKKAVESILDERKAGEFDSLNDFLCRVELDLSDAMALTNSGCLCSLVPKVTHTELAYRVAGFYLQNGNRRLLNTSPINNDLTIGEQYELELETFGFPLSCHPLDIYRSLISTQIKYAKDIPTFVGKSIYLVGIYISRKEVMTQASDLMEFLSLEDETDIYECILFPKVFQKYGDLLQWETLFILRGTVEEAFGVCNVNIEKIGSLPQWIKKRYSS